MMCVATFFHLLELAPERLWALSIWIMNDAIVSHLGSSAMHFEYNRDKVLRSEFEMIQYSGGGTVLR